MSRNRNRKPKQAPSGSKFESRPNHNNNKGGRPDKKERTFSNTKESSYEKNVYGENDSAWYTRNNQLNVDSGKLGYTYPLGAPINPWVWESSSLSFSIPGVMSFFTAPSVGVSDSLGSAVNIAAKNIYTYIRSKQSGAKNYDPADVMKYLLAMDSVYSMYAYMARAYGMLRLYSVRNRYYPKTIVRAMGLDFDDLVKRLADFRYFINQYAIKASTLCVPNIFSYFTRHIWLYSNIFADGPLQEDKVYLYNPGYLWKYDESVEPVRLTATALTGFNSSLTYDQLTTFASDLLRCVNEGLDIGVISGDILNAFGAGSIIKLSMISEDYTTKPLYSAEILEQIQNTVIGPHRITQSENAVTPTSGYTWHVEEYLSEGDPNNGALLFKPAMLGYVSGTAGVTDASGYAYAGKRLLSATDESPSPERVLTSTRLTWTAHTSGWDVIPDQCGSEIVYAAWVYYLKNDYSIGYTPVAYSMRPIADGIKAVANVVAFNKHPYVALNDVYSSATTLSNTGVFYELDNFALVGEHELRKMHETSLLSLFSIPYIG